MHFLTKSLIIYANIFSLKNSLFAINLIDYLGSSIEREYFFLIDEKNILLSKKKIGASA